MVYLKYALVFIFAVSSLGSVWVFVNRANLTELEWQSLDSNFKCNTH